MRQHLKNTQGFFWKKSSSTRCEDQEKHHLREKTVVCGEKSNLEVESAFNGEPLGLLYRLEILGPEKIIS